MDSALRVGERYKSIRRDLVSCSQTQVPGAQRANFLGDLPRRVRIATHPGAGRGTGGYTSLRFIVVVATIIVDSRHRESRGVPVVQSGDQWSETGRVLVAEGSRKTQQLPIGR